jgi:mannose-6-phosphate isomerase-like protein (cupin superfamily)
MSGAEPFVVLSGEGQMLRGPAGGPARILARAETTNGGFTALDNVIAPQHGPPEHIHLREDEMYYVLEGTVRFKAAGRYFEAPPGAFMFIPRGTPHCFQNVGEEPARLLVMFAPRGMERFFEGQAGMPPGPPDPEAYRQVAHSAWMEIVGPPMTSGEGEQGSSDGAPRSTL